MKLQAVAINCVDGCTSNDCTINTGNSIIALECDEGDCRIAKPQNNHYNTVIVTQ
jgi:hypothetical protein